MIANNPMFKGGVLFVDSADKAARFIQVCDAFGLPLLFLADVPGFMVGTAVERQGIIRHGAKMIAAMSDATVPKICVVVRKAYGAGLYAMAGPGFEPDATLAAADREDRGHGRGGRGERRVRGQARSDRRRPSARAETERLRRDYDRTSTSCGWPPNWSSTTSSSRKTCGPNWSAGSPPRAARTGLQPPRRRHGISPPELYRGFTIYL